MAHIHYQKGDIFDSNAQVIVNTVNCKGVMGKGLALAFKRKKRNTKAKTAVEETPVQAQLVS